MAAHPFKYAVDPRRLQKHLKHLGWKRSASIQMRYQDILLDMSFVQTVPWHPNMLIFHVIGRGSGCWHISKALLPKDPEVRAIVIASALHHWVTGDLR